MRVEVSPPRLSVVPGRPVAVTVQVTNTASVISGHELRVLGLDPGWVRVDQDQLSLFPDSAGVFVVTLELPEGIPAGVRTVELEVSELTPPNDVARVPLELTVPAEPNLVLSLDPVSATGAGRVSVGVLVENTGNAPLDVRLEGKDEEGQVEFEFSPPAPTLGPGERVLGTVALRARRPFLGSPKIRPYTVQAGSAQAPVIAFGVLVQRPRFTRGNLALFGLLAAATVFAVVLSTALSQVVGQSNANRDLALQVAEASQLHPSGGSSAIAGTVSQLGSGAPVGGVTVDLYPSANATQPVVSTATSATGGYHFSGLAAGSYKLSFDGAGFIQLWYPDSLRAGSAGVVTVKAGQQLAGVDIRLGGEPATISGQVIGADTTGALLSLELPGSPLPSPGPGPAGTGAAGAAPSGAAPSGAAVPTIVTTQTLDAAGKFALTGVPSPAVYDLVVTEPGYASATQEIDLGGGQNRTGVTIQLHKGDGSVSGTVSSPTGPLGGATIVASSGTTTLNTITATTRRQLGTFSLTSLPTPSTITLVVSAPGFASQTLSVSLAPAQQITGIAISLQPGVGSISGTVTTPAGSAFGGVTVTASDGSLTVSTTTLSAGARGRYALTGLPVPGTYTVTFSRPDLASQTQAVSLPATGTTNAKGVDVSMVSDTASLSGVVADATGQGVSEVEVSLVSGTTSYQTVSASLPTPGAFAIGGILPGTYNLSFTRQGGVPTSLIVHLAAGQQLVQNETLSPAASIFGDVVLATNGQPVPSAQVALYQAGQYPGVATATTTTASDGTFRFADVAAPQTFVVAVSYPAGSSPQETVLVTTSLGAATPVCGSAATGQLSSSPSPTPPTATTTATAPTTTTVPTTTSAPGPSAPTTTTATANSVPGTSVPGAAAAAFVPAVVSSCNPSSDPLKVSIP